MEKAKFCRLAVKETGRLLAKVRKVAHLTQEEVAKELGFAEKSGKVFISRLENGKLPNPSLKLVLDYLNVCKVPWDDFFDKLQQLISKHYQDELMSKISPQSHHQKIARDVSKYLHSMETKFSQKKQIKPLEPEKIEKTAIRFGMHRSIIESIEAEIHKLLCARGDVPFILFPFYKDFCRESYRAIRKTVKQMQSREDYGKKLASSLTNNKPSKTQTQTSVPSVNFVVNDKLNPIIEKWSSKGLRKDILEQIKLILYQHFNLLTDADK
ncbi:MAG: helix-turn-helix transcriptional regulator [candidate division WOR-3 bacterium]